MCSTSQRPRKRPFYRVSEEEYESCMRLLRHFVPGSDLDLQSMKSLIQEIEQKSLIPSGSLRVSHETAPSQIEQDNSAKRNSEENEAEESTLLQEENGCMIIDTLGKYSKYFSWRLPNKNLTPLPDRICRCRFLPQIWQCCQYSSIFCFLWRSTS